MSSFESRSISRDTSYREPKYIFSGCSVFVDVYLDHQRCAAVSSQLHRSCKWLGLGLGLG